MKARKATIPRKTTPPMTPPAIAPVFEWLLWAMGVEVAVALGVEVAMVVEVAMTVEERMMTELVVVAAGVDSGPPEAKISKCRSIYPSNVPAFSAAVTLNVFPD
jgi:hypothetical protein